MLACEQALLFGQAKRASRERASQGGGGKYDDERKFMYL